jgi:hypothetical protein
MNKPSILLPALLLFTTCFTLTFSIAQSQDKLSEVTLEKATREVDKKVVPENFEWVSRKKAEIRKEDGSLLEDPSDVTTTISNSAATEDLPPCAPCKLLSPRKR